MVKTFRPGRPAVHGPLLAADRQTLPSFGPAAFQNETSVLRAHSYQKTVRLSAPPRVRLKRPLSLTHDTPRRTNAKIRLANDLVCSTRPAGRWARRWCGCAWIFHRSRARTVNGSEAVPKVSISAALCYSRRPFTVPLSPVIRMRVWSLPRVFHTCGKNCGNSPGLTIHRCSGPIFRRSGEGRTGTPRAGGHCFRVVG